ncbi:AAA family ATPase, partial [Limnoraphis robusta]
VVILAGYTDNMSEFLQYNPGMKSRIPNEIEFKDYSKEQLLKIWNLFLKKEDFHYSSHLEKDLLTFFDNANGLELSNFGNARFVRNLFDSTKKHQSKRISTTKTINDISEIKESDIHSAIKKLYKGKLSLKKNELDFDELLSELNALVGLKSIKNQIEKQVNFFQIEKNRKRGIDMIGKTSSSNHMIFVGNPGTGKTTVARLIGKIYYGLNLLSSGHLVEASRSDFIAEYQGQTAIKTKRKVESAMGGVLFIDEAYSMNYGENDNFGQEAIDTIIKIMEDHKDNLIIVFAGYKKEMNNFLKVNSGLKSRIRHTLSFEDYSPKELLEIFKKSVNKAGLTISKSVEKHLLGRFEEELYENPEEFGNGRFVRNLFENALENQASRLANSRTISEKSMYTLTVKDFNI